MGTQHPDIIIIGAGIMGLAIAYQIARRSNSRILVLEKGTSLGEGSSGASSAVCRHRYTRDEMMILARDGIHAYRHWPEFTGIDKPLASFHEDGVLWFNDAGHTWAEQEAARLQSLDIPASVISAEDIRREYPAINPCLTPPDLETGEPHGCETEGDFLLETTGGYFDPVDALTDLASAASREGVDIRLNSQVQALVQSGGRAAGVTLASGEAFSAGIVINASGPWCREILAPLGLADRWPLNPTRIQVIHIDRPDTVRGHIPVCCDLPGGIYFRQQNRGQQIVVGSTREEDEQETVDPDQYNDWVDDDFKMARLHALQHRIPLLPETLRISGYTGLYTVNSTDVHPIVGRTGIDGFYVANGFSGHGFKAAPAIGSLLAQMITGDRLAFDTDVSPGFLAFDRDPIVVDAHNVLA